MIISVFNQKGGVGKSTTTYNLSVELHNMGKKVLMIDMDPQASLTIATGIEPANLKLSMYEVITSKCHIEDAIMNTHYGVPILPSVIDLSAAEIELAGMFARESILLGLLEPLRAKFDYILIDCPPSLGLLSISSLVASDYVIVPMVPEILVYRGYRLLKQTISMAQKLNSKLELMGILITRAESTLHHKEITKIIQEDAPYFETIIRKTTKYNDAVAEGLTIMDYCGMDDYVRVAKEVIEG